MSKVTQIKSAATEAAAAVAAVAAVAAQDFNGGRSDASHQEKERKGIGTTADCFSSFVLKKRNELKRWIG